MFAVTDMLIAMLGICSQEELDEEELIEEEVEAEPDEPELSGAPCLPTGVSLVADPPPPVQRSRSPSGGSRSRARFSPSERCRGSFPSSGPAPLSLPTPGLH